MLNPRSLDEVKQHDSAVHQLLTQVMKDGQHYGVIPNTKRMTLLKPGAEKIAFMFRLSAYYETTAHDLEGGHREYRVIASGYQEGSDELIAQGVGSCSSMESNYRYAGRGYEETGEPIPDDARDNKERYRRRGYGMKKVGGEWKWVRYTDEKAAREDIADTYNTVLKMARKRAYIDMVITAVGLSDMFTQDIDDPEEPAEKAKPLPSRKELVAEIVQLYKHDAFSDEERKALKGKLKSMPDNQALVRFLETEKARLPSPLDKLREQIRELIADPVFADQDLASVVASLDKVNDVPTLEKILLTWQDKCDTLKSGDDDPGVAPGEDEIF